MNFLGLDIGTTRMKCAVYNEEGRVLHAEGREYSVRTWGGECYLDLAAVLACAKALLRSAYRAVPFSCVTISSLGESFALLDGEDRLLFEPMLYTDARGEEEAAALKEHGRKIFAVSGASPQGFYSAYRLLWLKKHHPELYGRAEKLLLVADYVGYALTGERGADESSASRTGVFDIRGKTFSDELCELFGIGKELFSPPVPAGKIVGQIRREILAEWGAASPVLLVAGGHDQVCVSLGAGGTEAGVCVDGLGTVECLTALYETPSADYEMGRRGYVNVPHALGLYCSYFFNFSCGSLVRWWLDIAFPHGKGSAPDFGRAEAGFPEGPTDLLVLPYFAGAGTPYCDGGGRGAILNLTLAHTPSQIYKAVLEGLSLEMRVNLDEVKRFGIAPRKLIAAGGGSASRKWLEIKADVLGMPVYLPENTETGVCGAAILGASALTGEPMREVAARFVRLGEPILPDPARAERYHEIYERYRRLYVNLKPFQKEI